MTLVDRVVLVTGAGQGVGREVAITAASCGARAVVVNDVVARRAEAVAEEVRAAGARAWAATADVGDPAGVGAMVKDARHRFGRIDVLINNAGNAGPDGSIAEPTPFWESEPVSWERWIRTNFYGVLHCTHAVLGGMVAQRYGRIVTVISDAGRVGEPHLAVYSAAKAGAAGLTRAVAKAAGGAGVTANCVALGATVTPTVAGLAALEEDEERLARFLRSYVVKRLGRPADAAAAALFLASDAASWITGQTLPVNGGYSMAL